MKNINLHITNLLLNQLLQKIYIKVLKALFFNVILRFKIYKANELELLINFKFLYNILYFLKFHTLTQFKCLIDIILFDHVGKKFRFNLIYILLSNFNYRIKILTKIQETNFLVSINGLFLNSTWIEREIFDFFGTIFIYNNDLRRILNDYGFQGFPLKKDFPLIGFNEILYDDNKKQIISKKLEINQLFKNFNLLKIWK